MQYAWDQNHTIMLMGLHMKKILARHEAHLRQLEEIESRLIDLG